MTHRPSCKACSMTAAATPQTSAGRCFGSRPGCGGSPPCEKWTLKPGRCAALGRGVCKASCMVEAHPLRVPGGRCADPSAAWLHAWSSTAPLQVLRSKALPERDFGEGVTRMGDRLYQVTWMSGRGWSYAVDNFDNVKEITTPLKDGWGITSDGTHLIVGDSSETLYWLDPHTLEVARKVTVTDGGQPVKWLNELEWVEGLIWGNVWQTDCIAQVDPATGAVVGWLRASDLHARALAAAKADADAAKAGGKRAAAARNGGPEVLNGIAYDADSGRLFITGKLWPRIYQIETAEVAQAAAADALALARKQCIVHQ